MLLNAAIAAFVDAGRDGSYAGAGGAEAAGADEEQAGGRIEAGRHPVRGAVRTWRNEGAIGLGLFRRIRNRLAARVDAERPIGGDKWRVQDMFASGAVEQEEVAIAAGLGEQLAMDALIVIINEHRGLDRVPIVGVVRGGLKMPDQFAGIGVERNDGAGVKVVAFANVAVENGIGISNTPK